LGQALQHEKQQGHFCAPSHLPPHQLLLLLLLSCLHSQWLLLTHPPLQVLPAAAASAQQAALYHPKHSFLQNQHPRSAWWMGRSGLHKGPLPLLLWLLLPALCH
jgi:hypothetical protein